MKELTGEDKISTAALLEYFKPLQAFLDKQLKDQSPGWKIKG